MKARALRCDSCGGTLQNIDNQPNIRCEYCGTYVRVLNDPQSQFDSEAIVNQIAQIWPRVRSDNFTAEYEKIRALIDVHKFLDAKKRLDVILEKDETQSRAWFYKSMLPILDQETVLFGGYHINVVRVAQITDRKLLRQYLKSCGLRSRQRKKFMSFYRSTDFLYEQQIKYVDKAIKHTKSDDRHTFFQNFKEELIAAQQKKIRRKRFSNGGLIVLLAVSVVGLLVAGWIFVVRDLLNGLY